MLSLCHHLLTTDGWLAPSQFLAYKTSPVIKMKSIEKYFGKRSVKASDTANVIFMSSFTNNRHQSPGDARLFSHVADSLAEALKTLSHSDFCCNDCCYVRRVRVK